MASQSRSTRGKTHGRDVLSNFFTDFHFETMDVPNTRRIVLIGKTGAGKSSLANTIFGEEVFTITHSINSETKACHAKTKSIGGKNITLIDNPGFFDLGKSEEDMKPELLRCITECAPGPHAFLIVLKVEKFTEHEKAVITQMCEHFSEDALTYAAVVFTHGDQLPEEMKIEEYVSESESLSDLVKKCGGRCHIVDNKYWKNNQQDEYRSNKFQVAELLNTIDKIVTEKSGGCYTNEKLQAVESEIQKEEEHIRQSSLNMTQEVIRQLAKNKVFKKQVENASQTWIRGLVGLAVITGLVAAVTAVLMKGKFVSVIAEAPFVDEEFIAPSLPEVIEKIPEIATPPDDVISPVQVIKNAFEAIVDKLTALYESTYNPWSPFE